MNAASFLAAIREAPDDDVPRLVFADWLEDTGEPDRAEFVRAQVEAVHLPDHDPRRDALERRARELRQAHASRWLADLPLWAWEAVVFRRGMVGELRCTAE